MEEKYEDVVNIETVSEARCFGGVQGVYKHHSDATGTPMSFSLFLPPAAEQGPVPLIWFLSGLTCTPMNVTEKGEYRAACAELGLALVAPDTSPRGEGVADDPDGSWDLGLGAGFYVDATKRPWAPHYRMWSYIAEELPSLVGANFTALDMGRQSIMGHSMGGHGALTMALRHPGRFASASAFAPIVAPSQIPWGQKAFTAYLGDDRGQWAEYDSVALIDAGREPGPLLVDIGTADPFFERELRPELLEDACARSGIPLKLNRRTGYDHSYYFISTFMGEHLRWHSAHLAR